MTRPRRLVAVAATIALASSVIAGSSASAPAAAAGPLVFSSQEPIVIPDAGNATPYPATIQVSGLTTPVTDVNVTLTGLTQDCLTDLAVLLVAPSGQRSLLMADVTDSGCFQGPDRAQNVNLTFDDAAAGPVPDPVVSGSYRPTDGQVESPDEFPPPAPAGGSHPTALSAFNGIAGNGTWSLFVRDEFGLPARADTEEAGTIASGWSLSVTTATVADSTAPDTTITKRPTYRHPRHSRFKFTSNESGVTFRCSLDGRPSVACGPKADYVGLKKGRHTLSVYAVDAAGNIDPTPARATWRVWPRGTGHTSG